MKKSFTEDGWRKDPRFRALCNALASCKTPDAVAALLRDVGTLSELQAWSERLEIARQLSTGRSYRAIAEDTGASTATVTRVASFLSDGEGGYRNVVSHQHHHASSRGEKMASMPAR